MTQNNVYSELSHVTGGNYSWFVNHFTVTYKDYKSWTVNKPITIGLLHDNHRTKWTNFCTCQDYINLQEWGCSCVPFCITVETLLAKLYILMWLSLSTLYISVTVHSHYCLFPIFVIIIPPICQISADHISHLSFQQIQYDLVR